ncbi:diaminopimelate decarboxylase [Gaiella sp.]|uniref:diaminopimelate decarboxylase n=1 Tax=Gaiella sp. TaxID=2663207 RepID=UPI0032650129
MGGVDHDVLDLFPDSARIKGATLTLGGLTADELAAEFGTPLVVYCEETLRARARSLRAAVTGGHVAFGAKAFSNVAVLKLFREEGLGVDVASTGELAFARAAGFRGDEIIVHGNNKDAALLAEAGAEGATVVLDAPDEAELAAAAGVKRVLVRVTLGVDADTHEAIRTGHHGSKFGLPVTQARSLIEGALECGLDVLGLHVHIGSQLADFDAQAETIVRLASFAAGCRDSLGWVPKVADLGGGFGIRHNTDEHAPDAATLAAGAVETAQTAFREAGLPTPEIWLEPGRSLVGTAGVTLYRVGAVKRLPERTWVAVDGGMSDNPRPQLYEAVYTAVSATRADERAGEHVSIAGMHCESGDVLIDDVALPTPHRGDLLAVPATGAYTLAMASNYNGVTRPAAVLVGDGAARLIRTRETIADLLRAEV